jgi:hypothetical protein
MALKDWEKTRKGVNKEFKEIKWSNNKDSTYLSAVYDGEMWRVWLYDVFDDQGEELKKDGFKTKAQALRFVKDYMRTH